MSRYQHLLFATVLIGLTVLAVLARSHWIAHDRERDRMLAFSNQIGEIKRIDEILTMSARLAIASSDASFAERHGDHIAPLREEIVDTQALAVKATDRALVSNIARLTDAAIRTEQRALRHLVEGTAENAAAILESGQYREIKTRSTQAIELASAHLSGQFRAAAERESRMLQFLIGGLCTAAVILLAIILYIRGERAEAERRKTQIETLGAVMASVMDAQNNFLNNMVYFRTKAEASSAIDPGDIRQIDEAIQDARLRLIEIAETDDFETRDLGGLRVLERRRARRDKRRLAG